MKKTKLFLLALISLCFCITGVKAEEVTAKIGDNEYNTLDAAIEDAKDGDVIELINDASIETTIAINNSITINGNNKTITISKLPSDDGRLSISSNVTLNNVTVDHANDNDNQNAWSVYMSSTGVLNLNDSTYILRIHGLYASPEATINLNNSKLIAKDMTYTAFMQGDVEDKYAYINLFNNSLLKISDISNSSAGNGTNWFDITADNSHISVTDCARQGLVGGRLELKNGSTADYSSNEIGFTLYELDYVIVNEGTTLNINNNSSVGIWQYGGEVRIKDNGTLNMTGNGFGRGLDSVGKYNGATINIANYYGNAKVVFEDNATVKINNNYTRGITNRGEVYVGSMTEIMNNGLVTIDGKMIPQYGGGIYNTGIMTISKNVKLYNNHARLAGDDIYNIGTVTFSNVGEDWILDDCEHKINGWYDDAENSRWEAHDKENLHIDLIEGGEYTSVTEDGEIAGALAIKAAHDNIGKVVINYLDSDSNKLTEEVTITGEVGSEYTTIKKEFDDYTFIMVEGPTSGEYDFDTIYVTYYYDKNTGTGDIMPPQTGFEPSTINSSRVEVITVYKKED
mgnify:FL=1